MATTKKTTTTRSSTRTPARRKAVEPSFIASTERTIKKNPYASAAVATGLISAIAGAAAGFFAWKKSGKSFTDFSNDVATSAKGKAADVTERVKDGLADAQTIAKEQVAKIRDGLDSGKSQSEIAEEALSLKTTGDKGTTFPLDPVVDSQIKTGAVSY